MGILGIFNNISKLLTWAWVCLTTGLKGKRVKAGFVFFGLCWAIINLDQVMGLALDFYYNMCSIKRTSYVKSN